MTRRLAALAALCLLPLAAGGFLAAGRDDGGLLLFNQVRSLVAERYVDAQSDSILFTAAARGLVAELDDPYAELITPKEVQAFTTGTTGRYGGVGLLVEDHEGRTIVRKVFPNTPAERAGVLAGDRIVAVDEVSTVDWKFGEVTTALKGTPGTTVQATFEREGVTEPITVSLTRAIIHTPSVPYALMLDGDVGYVPLQTFNETATAEVREALTRLVRQGARGLVLDLRGNGGGIMDQAVTLANLFLPAGLPVATVRYRAAAPESLVTAGRPLDAGLPLVVLVDGASASATEIVAGALQDHDRAAIVGTTTFGKGLVQSIFRLQGGHLLKLTTGRWYTPSGRSIHKPRKLVDGRLVDDSLPDSLETEAVKRERPAYRSTGGRVVYGGGAVAPDLIVRPDTLVATERRILAAIAPKSQAVYLQLYDFASKRKAGLRPDFTVSQAWRDDLYARLGEAGVTLPRAAYDSAQGFVDELIANHVARVAFGDSAARRRDLPRDVQLTRALELLEGKRTQAEVFEKVVAAK